MMPVSERVRPEPRWPGIHHRSLRNRVHSGSLIFIFRSPSALRISFTYCRPSSHESVRRNRSILISENPARELSETSSIANFSVGGPYLGVGQSPIKLHEPPAYCIGGSSIPSSILRGRTFRLTTGTVHALLFLSRAATRVHYGGYPSLQGPYHSPLCCGPSLLTVSMNHISTIRMTKTGEIMPARSQTLSTSSVIQNTADVNAQITPMVPTR